MKIILPGGSGQLGQILKRSYESRGHQVIVIGRSKARVGNSDYVRWDGKTSGEWESVFQDADVVINLAGRTVNCRYTEANLQQMMNSRVDSTLAVGRAISNCDRPPRLWLQMSTATIYSHRFDAANDELTGHIGGGEPHAPEYWKRSIEIAKRWEQTLNDANVNSVRKILLRTAMVMSPGPVRSI